MGSGSTVTKNYKTNKGYFVLKYLDISSGEKMRFFITPINGFDGLFFYVSRQDGGFYEVTGEGYIHQENWAASMAGFRAQIKETKRKLKESGKIGYFFIDKTGQVIQEEWIEYKKDKKL